MATRDGHKIGKVLVDHYGWQWNMDGDPDVYGDCWVIDPVDMKVMNPYQALEVACERVGLTDSDSPMRHVDHVYWLALCAVEFAESVPAEAMINPSVAAEAWSRLRHLAEYAKREGVV